jgi:hypothetical protein
MEAEREPRGLIVLRVPLEGGGRLVVSINDEEAENLHQVLAGVIKTKK